MRACFLGQNICALGYGVATLQSPPLIQDEQTGEPRQPGGALDQRDHAALQAPAGAVSLEKPVLL